MLAHFNYYKSLSGIETYVNDYLHYPAKFISITTNPYQGLKRLLALITLKAYERFQLLQIPIRDWNFNIKLKKYFAPGFQLLQIPIRDWNKAKSEPPERRQFQLLQIPIRDWNCYSFSWYRLPQHFNYYKSLSGIETFIWYELTTSSIHFNYYKSLSGIETASAPLTHLRSSGISITTNPYQGLKPQQAQL